MITIRGKGLAARGSIFGVRFSFFGFSFFGFLFLGFGCTASDGDRRAAAASARAASFGASNFSCTCDRALD